MHSVLRGDYEKQTDMRKRNHFIVKRNVIFSEQISQSIFSGLIIKWSPYSYYSIGWQPFYELG